MKILTEKNGDEFQYPDDQYEDYGMPAMDWIKREKFIHGDQTEADRINLFAQALSLYFTESGNKDLTKLRGKPWVIENYDIYTNNSELFFIFKEDSNGITYRIG